MDSNNPPAAGGPTPVSPQPTPPQAEDNKGSNKIILWFVIGLVIVVVAVGGIYLFLSSQQAATPKPTPRSATTQTPKPSPAENLEADLNSINLDAETDLSEIDKDLQAL